MGYRLSVQCEDPTLSFYGTNLYGYVDPERLASKRYLQLTFPDYDPDASYWEGDPELNMSEREFVSFIALYLYDWKICYGEDLEETNPELVAELRKIAKTPGNKTVSWW